MIKSFNEDSHNLVILDSFHIKQLKINQVLEYKKLVFLLNPFYSRVGDPDL